MSASNLMSPSDAAEYLGGLALSTLATWRYKGEGPVFTKMGTRVMYRKADLDAYIERNIRQSTGDNNERASSVIPDGLYTPGIARI